MSKRFIITARAQESIDAIITSHLMQTSFGVWHYITNVWFLAGVSDSTTSKSLFEELEKLPGMGKDAWIVVTEISDNPEFWGMAPAGCWEWMGQCWGKPSS
jgi:hypothetical protein